MPSRSFSRRADLKGIDSRQKAAKLFHVVWPTVVPPIFNKISLRQRRLISLIVLISLSAGLWVLIAFVYFRVIDIFSVS